VSFFLAATDEAFSARRTAAIHKEKFNVPLSDENKEHLKTCTGLEGAKASEKSQKAPGHDC